MYPKKPANKKDSRLGAISKIVADASIPNKAEAVAAQFGISERQAKRLIGQAKEVAPPKKDIPVMALVPSEAGRDVALDTKLDVLNELQWGAAKLRQTIEKLAPELEAAIEAGEGIDAILVSSYGKLFDSMNNIVTTAAKVSGLINDAPQLAVFQIDADVEDTIAILKEYDSCPHCGEAIDVAKYLYERILGKSPRRRRRFEEYANIETVEGEYTEL